MKKSPLLKYTSLTLLACLCGLTIITLPTDTIRTQAQAGSSGNTPFGGQIKKIFPACVRPFGSVMEIGPPTPMRLMYVPGQSKSYLYGPPKSTGQWLLGLANRYNRCLVPCRRGLCSYKPMPGGLTIWFHGSSK